MIWRRPGFRQGAEGHLRQHDRLFASDVRFGQKLVARSLEDVEAEVGDRAKAPAFDQDRPLVEHLGRLDHLARGGEQCRVGEASLHELEADEAVVDVGEGRALEVDDVDLDSLRVEPVQQRADQLRRRRVGVKRAVDQIDAENAERALLAGRLAVEQPDVEHDLRRLRARPRLEAHAEPGVAFPGPRWLAVATVLAKTKKVVLSPRFAASSLHERRTRDRASRESLPADVALAGPVAGIPHLLVVGRDGLGDRARRAADAEKPARHLLAGADLGEGPVLHRVEIDLESFLLRRRGGHPALAIACLACAVKSRRTRLSCRGRASSDKPIRDGLRSQPSFRDGGVVAARRWSSCGASG